MSQSARGRLVGAASLGATLALMVTAIPAAAAPDSGNITVSGGSIERIRLTIPDDTAAFGADLTPDGQGGSAEVDGVWTDPANPSEGACYDWAGTVQVRSNVTYDLLVSSSNDVAVLGFLTTTPTDWASCVAGEPASSGMFASATPPGEWAGGETRTARRTHDFDLGLDVRWDADPSATLANTTLTITAQAAS